MNNHSRSPFDQEPVFQHILLHSMCFRLSPFLCLDSYLLTQPSLRQYLSTAQALVDFILMTLHSFFPATSHPLCIISNLANQQGIHAEYFSMQQMRLHVVQSKGAHQKSDIFCCVNRAHSLASQKIKDEVFPGPMALLKCHCNGSWGEPLSFASTQTISHQGKRMDVSTQENSQRFHLSNQPRHKNKSNLEMDFYCANYHRLSFE